MPQSCRLSPPLALDDAGHAPLGHDVPDWSRLAAPLRRLVDRRPDEFVAALRGMLGVRSAPPRER